MALVLEELNGNLLEYCIFGTLSKVSNVFC